MKRIALAVALALFAHAALAQDHATTRAGRAVDLNADGTWRYSDAEAAGGKGAVRSAKALTKVDIGRTGYAFYFDPAKWVRKPDDAEKRMIFASASGDDVYAMIIQERLQVDVDNLVKIALDNAKSVAPDARILDSAPRTVNGHQLRAATIAGTTQGIKFIYHSYYFSGKGGVVQVVTYTGANLFEEFRPQMDEFLNGFVGGE